MLVLQPHISRNYYGLGFSAFARHYSRNHYLFSLPLGTKMFQFPRFASLFRDNSNFIGVGCPIRKSTDQFVLTNPRSLSQFVTSFIASESQGIPHTPLLFFSL
jgi:hypothetical protein